MHKEKARPLLRRILPIALFVLGCFPARGLYFLLHSPQSDEFYQTSQPVFSAPTSSTPKWKAAKVPLPARLTRVPRGLKHSPSIPATNQDPALAVVPDRAAFRLVAVSPDLFLAQASPASPPPSRAPPASL